MTLDSLKPNSITPPYPPYHKGDYLEEYFSRRWNQEIPQKNRKYIDVFWTNIFCNKAFSAQKYPNIQKFLDETLDKNEQYFTVCQFDDGPLEKFPKETKIFSAGGNRKEGNIIPIPLICSPIPRMLVPKASKKTIFASFIGSDTHQIRKKMIESVSNKKDYVVETSKWSVSVPIQNFYSFIKTTAFSKFSLAPRGYGKSSFRLYEIMQLGSVPVYISDDHYLPWEDELNWKDFCVLIKESEIEHLDEILRSIKEDEYEDMLEIGKRVYEKYFTMEGMYQNILKRI